MYKVIIGVVVGVALGFLLGQRFGSTHDRHCVRTIFFSLDTMARSGDATRLNAAVKKLDLDFAANINDPKVLDRLIADPIITEPPSIISSPSH